MTAEPVVVGVDDTVDARSAVVWAAHEAALADTSLLIVHSPRLPAAGTAGGYLSAALRASDDVGRSVLDSSVALARGAEPGVVVRTLLSHADPAQALIDVSAQAQLVVLGSRHGPAGGISLLASKRLLVVAHSHCPVLLLGPVSMFSPPGAVSRVVAGLADTKAGWAAVEFAAAEAVRRNIALHLVRLAGWAAVRETAGAQPVVRGIAGTGPVVAELATAPPAAGRRRGDQLAVAAARIRSEHPGLRVLVESVTGDAAELLPSYSDSSSILVVGCHHTDDHWSTRLGPVATSVVHRNRGAVVVVGSTHRPLAATS